MSNGRVVRVDSEGDVRHIEREGDAVTFAFTIDELVIIRAISQTIPDMVKNANEDHAFIWTPLMAVNGAYFSIEQSAILKEIETVEDLTAHMTTDAFITAMAQSLMVRHKDRVKLYACALTNDIDKVSDDDMPVFMRARLILDMAADETLFDSIATQMQHVGTHTES